MQIDTTEHWMKCYTSTIRDSRASPTNHKYNKTWVEQSIDKLWWITIKMWSVATIQNTTYGSTTTADLVTCAGTSGSTSDNSLPTYNRRSRNPMDFLSKLNKFILREASQRKSLKKVANIIRRKFYLILLITAFEATHGDGDKWFGKK